MVISLSPLSGKSAPVALCKDITVYLGAGGSVTITGASVDNGSSDPAGIASLLVTPNSFTCSEIGANAVVLIVTNNSGEIATCNPIVTVLDNTPPTILCPGNINLYLDGSGRATLNTSDLNSGSTDNCSSVLSYSLSRTAFNCSDIGTPVSVTLTGSDASLNSATCNSLVTVLDTIKPVVNVKPFTLVLDPLTGTGTLLPENVDNGSFDNCGPITLSVTPDMFNCSNEGTNTVTFTAVDSNGNSRSKTVRITVSSTLNIDAMSLSSCEVAAPFAIYTATVSGGTGTYGYFWDIIEEGIDPFVTFDAIPPYIHFLNTSSVATPFFNNLMPDGIYHIRLAVEDGNGCTAVSQMELNKSGLVFDNITRIYSAACEGETKTYSVAAAAGATYSWNVTNGTIIGPANTNAVTVQWSMGATTGLLTASITKPDLLGNSCGSSVENYVTVNAIPLPVLNSPVISGCSDSEYTYTLTGTYASYRWTVTGGAITGGGSVNDSFVKVRWGAGPSGNVTVNVTNSGGCTNSAISTVTINGLPVPTLTSSDADNIFCEGTSITFTASGGSNYNFRVDGISVQNSAVSTYTTTAIVNGQVVDVIVTNPDGCSAASAGITNTVNSYPTPALISSDADNTFCAGTSVTFMASGGTAYNFRVAGISVQNSASPAYTTSLLTNGQIVDVIVSNAGGCSTTSACIVNTVLDLPTPTLTSSDADNTFCAGTSVTFTAGGGINYNFRVDGVSVQNGASQVYITTSLTDGQVVDVIVTNAAGCSATSAGITNNVGALPAPVLTSSDSDNIFCAGTSVTFTTSGGTNYNFRVNGSSVQNGASPIYTTSTLTNGQIVDVIVTNAGGCIGTSAGITNTVLPNNTVVFTSAPGTDNQTRCINTAITNITYATTGATGATVTGLPAGVTGVWAADVVTISGTPTASGVFNYTVTLTGGCGTVTTTGVITVIPDNTIVLSSAAGTDSQNICTNEAITNITYTTTGATDATVTGLPAGVTGVWAADVVTISGTPTTSGVYNYTVTLTGGCGTITAAGVIIVAADNTIVLSSSAGTDSQTICNNTAITTIIYATTGATGATVTGLPAGVSGVWAADVVTISGTPTGSGVFNYTVTLTGGCGTATSAGVITVTTDNTIVLSSAAGTDSQTRCINAAITNITYTTTGATGATVTGLPAGVSGVWAANVVTISGTPTASGVFNYTVTLTGGCGTLTAAGVITVTTDNAIVLSSSSGTDNQSICINTAITTITYVTTGATGATVTGLPAGVTGVWAADVVTISGTPTVLGVYNYSVALTGGCGTVTAAGVITVTPENTIVLSSAAGTDNQTGCSNSAITNITYTTTGATGATVTGLPAGVTAVWAANLVTISGIPTVSGVFNYIVTLTGGCGTGTASGILTINPSPNVTSSQTNVLCHGESTGSINITVTGGTGPYSYAWTGAGVVTAAEDQNGLAAGTYSVIVTDSKTCTSAPLSVTITEPAADLSGSILSRTNVACYGESTGSVTVLASGGTAPYLYNINGSPFQVSDTFTGLAAGSYNITIRDDNLCTTIINVNITEPSSALSGFISSQTNTICSESTDGSVTITGAGGTPPYEFSMDGGTYQPGSTFNGLSGGTHTVVVRDANLCTFSINVTITSPAPITGTVISQTNVLCFGSLTGSVILSAAGGSSPYQYSIDGGAFQASPAFNGLAAGTHSVIVQDFVLCTTSISFTITQPAVAFTGSTAVTNVRCFGGNTGAVDLTVSGGTPPYTFLWSNGAATEDLTNLSAGTYTVTITDANNCTVSASGTVTQPAVLAGSIAITNASCFGGSTGAVNLTVSGGTSPFTFLWSNGATTEDLDNVVAGTYTVTITDANSCTANASATVTQPAALGGAIISQTDALCFAGNSGSVTAAGSGGTPGYMYRIGNGTYQVSGTFNALIAGTYSITVMDANSCTFVIPVTIAQPPVLDASITSQTNVSVPGGNDGSVTVAATGGTSPYLYKLGAGPYQVSGTFGSLTAGSYTITVQDIKLCTFNITVTITQPSPPLSGTITSQTNIVCSGVPTGSITVAASGGIPPYEYKLGTGPYQISPTFVNLAAGSYIVTIRDATLNTFIINVTISQPSAALNGTIISRTNVSCSGLVNGSLTVGGAGGTPPYQYSLNGSAFQASGSYGGLAWGNYTVTVRDANLCSFTVPVALTEPGALSISSEKTDASCPDVPDGSITLTISGGTPPYNVIWSDGVILSTRSNIHYGTYGIVVTDKNGCASSLNVVVGIVGTESCLEIQEIITPNNDGFNDIWKIKNIDLFPNAEVFVFTRWGKLVFHSKNLSANPWDGTFEGKLLPTDSYHYILHLNDGSKTRSGVVSIIR